MTTTTEYDRFGPWIDDVRTPEDVPPLFRDHPVDLAGAELVLKVPRNIARRDATPDMDLYDHLLVLDDERLTVLSRRAEPDRSGRAGATVPGPDGRGYDVRVVPLAQVVAVRDVVDLLAGGLTVTARDGSSVSVAYNGSARENVRRLVDALRDGATRAAPSRAGRALLAAGRAQGDARRALAIGTDDLVLVADVRDVARHRPDLTPWVGHGRRRVHRAGGGAAAATRPVLGLLSPVTLHAAVVAGDDAAVEVFARHEWLLTGRQPVHSSARLVVPLAALDGVRVAPHPRYAQVVVATLSAGAAVLEVVVPEESDAHRLLAAVARS